MKKTRKSNSGFTLVELIIAMAILAFLMTAVSAFMSSGVLSFRKAKADQAVNTAAQTVYDQLADTVMAAQDVYVYAYMTKNPGERLNFTESEADTDVDLIGPYYFVRDKAQADKLKAMPEYVSGTDIFYFSDSSVLASDDVLYVKSIIVDKASDLDLTSPFMEAAEDVATSKYKNQLTKEVVTIQKLHRESNLDSSGTVVSVTGAESKSSLGKNTYNVNDTERNIFTFEDKSLYYEKKYAFMTGLDDTIATSGKRFCLYSESFSFLNGPAAGETVSGCAMQIDAKNGAVSFDLEFSDKNMTYTGKGMLNTRNSFVLKPKK